VVIIYATVLKLKNTNFFQRIAIGFQNNEFHRLESFLRRLHVLR